MGTNFYMLTGQHVGKRSAAGMYCWDCDITLCQGRVHYGDPYYDACPKCGKTRETEGMDDSAAGRELGFNKSVPAAKAGVRSCSSFTWANEPSSLEGVAVIEDEYGRRYTRQEFREMLEECPIQFTDSIGVEFS